MSAEPSPLKIVEEYIVIGMKPVPSANPEPHPMSAFTWRQRVVLISSNMNTNFVNSISYREISEMWMIKDQDKVNLETVFTVGV